MSFRNPSPTGSGSWLWTTICPCLDGNGRVGRLLITFHLCARGALSKPILYLQHYFKQHRQEYYEPLQAVRARGEWREWLTILGARYNPPLLAVKDVIELTGTSYPSTSDLVAKFVDLGCSRK